MRNRILLLIGIGLIMSLGSFLYYRHLQKQELIIRYGSANEQADSLNKEALRVFPPVDSGAIVLIGTSLTAAFPEHMFVPDVTLHNRGIHSNRLFHLQKRIGAILRRHPRVIVIEGGINDLLSGVDPLSVGASLKDLLDSALILSPNSKILLLSVLPVMGKDSASLNPKVRAVNQQTKTWADMCRQIAQAKTHPGMGYENVYYIDIYDKMTPAMYNGDVHINEDGYIVWAAALVRFLYENKSSRQ